KGKKTSRASHPKNTPEQPNTNNAPNPNKTHVAQSTAVFLASSGRAAKSLLFNGMFQIETDSNFGADAPKEISIPLSFIVLNQPSSGNCFPYPEWHGNSPSATASTLTPKRKRSNSEAKAPYSITSCFRNRHSPPSTSV